MSAVSMRPRTSALAAALLLSAAAPSSPASTLGAQAAVITAPKQAAQRAAGASNARLESQMSQARAAEAQAGQTIGPRGRTPQAIGVPPVGARGTGVVQSGAPDPGGAGRAPDPPNAIMREVFQYASQGRRDPFFSLMATGDLRPMLSDLRLTTILYDLSGRRPVAVMNDVSTNQQYRVTTGMMLGRMRVTQIRPRKVLFAIDEFGFSRADSLVLADKPVPRK
jgi:hypothetical protein